MELFLGTVGIIGTLLIAIFTGVFKVLHSQVARISHLEGRFDLLYDDKRFKEKVFEIKQQTALDMQTLLDNTSHTLTQLHDDLIAQLEHSHAQKAALLEQQMADIRRLLENIEQQLANFQAQLSTAQTQLLHDKQQILTDLEQASVKLIGEIDKLPVHSLVVDVGYLKQQLLQLPKKRQQWWQQLDASWQAIFRKIIGIAGEPHDYELSKILALQVLDCKGNKLSTLEPLRHLTQLHTLNCANNQVTTLEPLRQLTRLQTLNCASNQLTSLEPLNKLVQLQSLNCENNQLMTLEPLKYLNCLQKLECDGNQLTRLSPLEKLSNLTELHLATSWLNKHNPLTQQEIEQFKQRMPQCKIEA